MIVGKEQEVARHGAHRFAPIRKPDRAMSLGQEMEKDDVVGARQLTGGAMQSVLRLGTPGRGEFGVDVDGAIHADGRQHFRQHVQWKAPRRG